MTGALLGFGVLFKFLTSTGPDVYTTIGEQNAVTPYDVSVDSIDATHEQSPGAWKEFIPGLKDGGSIELTLHYIPGGAVEAQLLGYLGSTQVCRSTFPSGAYVGYSAFITSKSPDTPIDGKMTTKLKMKITGPVTPVTASAPSNTRLPSIAGSDGVPNVGDTLTAVDGVWANEPTSFMYQWKAAGTNVAANGTGKTYIPVSGDATKVITVTVIAVNSAGNASATSMSTVAIS